MPCLHAHADLRSFLKILSCWDNVGCNPKSSNRPLVQYRDHVGRRTLNESTFRDSVLMNNTIRERAENVFQELDLRGASGVYDPDLWTDEYAMLSRPGETAIQSDLFYDYRTNVASYPQWQAWLRKTQPKTLVIWGRYDPSQPAAEAPAYGRDLPHAEIHVMDAGHFALDLAPDADAIAAWMRDFLGCNGL
ncbi:alpha/beta fold hydrolase [Burkholderia sp. L27(2015)]|uniref:alpha/beta fold hydrolase n=1 Tax=Burkholderia sp. L27(2015) TaxID=1641858 RepID=UPI00349E77F9